MKPVSVVSLLVWDSVRYLDCLLRNLDAFPPGGPFHLRILDQGSGPETRAILQDYQSRHSHVAVDYLDANIGYSAGHNRNYETVRRIGHFDYFVTINNDLVFGEPGWLDTLVQAMEAAPTAAIGGPTCYTSEPGMIRPASRAEKESGRYLFVSGAVSIIRTAAVRRLGLFDEVYTPAYWEDADMCMRYMHFGLGQKYIDIPMFHAYLGEADRVNQAKNAGLLEQFGDFRTRNMYQFHERWGTAANRAAFAPEAELRTACPKLYLPVE